MMHIIFISHLPCFLQRSPIALIKLLTVLWGAHLREGELIPRIYGSCFCQLDW